MPNSRFQALLRPMPEPKFDFIDPPFDFNAPGVSAFPPEVTGFHLLNSLCRRIGWDSLAGKRLLDFGCGVRFTRTLVKLGIDFGFYAGIDVNQKAIAWLKDNVGDPRFRFEWLNIRNQMYNPGGSSPDRHLLTRLSLGGLDAACMYSVITHQAPGEAALTFAMLRECLEPGKPLYFTAFVDEGVDEYVERDPEHRGHMSTYNPDVLTALVEESGWRVQATYARAQFQQAGFVCR